MLLNTASLVFGCARVLELHVLLRVVMFFICLFLESHLLYFCKNPLKFIFHPNRLFLASGGELSVCASDPKVKYSF